MLTRLLPLLRGPLLCAWELGVICYAHDDGCSLVVSVEWPFCCHINSNVGVLSFFICTSIVPGCEGGGQKGWLTFSLAQLRTSGSGGATACTMNLAEIADLDSLN